MAVETSAGPAEVSALLRAATADCPALQLLREAVTGGFTLEHNGRGVPLGGVESPTVGDPADELQSIQPAPELVRPELITKLSTAPAVPGVPGGAGSSLQAVQNRTLVIQGDASWRDEPFWRADIALAQPIGSSFRFLSPARDDAGPAPDSLDYLVAGIAFCFMTQLGRYAQIKKLPLHSYRLVQFTSLLPRPAIVTHVFVESDLDDAAAADLVRTGERTCFLHAALRANLPPVIRAELNDAPLSF